MTRPARHRILERRKRGVRANTTIAVRAILDAARRRGIDVGVSADGELVLVAPARVPPNVHRWFAHWVLQFESEILDLLRDTGMRSMSNQAEPTKETEVVH